MEVPQKVVCSRIQTQLGEERFLLVRWWSGALFDVEVIAGAAAYKAQSCRCPVETDVGPDVWLQKAQEALGYAPQGTPFEYASTVDTERCELRWYYPINDAELRGMGRLELPIADYGATLQAFLTTACTLSKAIADMTVENTETQRGIERDMQLLEQEVKETTHSRKTLYIRCRTLFNEKKREIEEKDREIKELRARLEGGDDPYSDVTS